MRTTVVAAFMLLLWLAVPASAAQLRASNDQLFWVTGSWIPASDLRPGDQFTTADGRVAIVTNVTSVRADESLSCYGLHTEVPHDILAHGVLAHDATLPRCACYMPVDSVPAQTRWHKWADSLRRAWRALCDALNKGAVQGE